VVTEAEIVIDNDVILDGEGKLTVDGNENHRVFLVPQDVEAEIHGFTVTGGVEYFAYPGGGGIANEGTLVVDGCFILNNHIEPFDQGYDGGGGIWNAGQMTIANSTVAGNLVTHGVGGGIYNRPSGTLTLTNSTVASNHAGTDGGSNASAGVQNGGQMIIVNSTVSGNRMSGFILSDTCGTGITSTGRLFLINSTISDNTAGNDFGDALATKWTGASSPVPHVEIAHTLIDGECTNTCEGPASNATWVFHGYNIESPGDTCGFDQTGDQSDVTAEQLNLGPLADNSGPTMTHALLTEPTVSVAIDKIPEEDCEVDTDQRGEPRPGGTACDVGAFEVQP
jgi:hypothetical protein